MNLYTPKGYLAWMCMHTIPYHRKDGSWYGGQDGVSFYWNDLTEQEKQFVIYNCSREEWTKTGKNQITGWRFKNEKCPMDCPTPDEYSLERRVAKADARSMGFHSPYDRNP